MPENGDVYENNGVFYAVTSIDAERGVVRVQSSDGSTHRWPVADLEGLTPFAKTEKEWAFIIRKPSQAFAIKDIRIPRKGDVPLVPIRDWLSLNGRAIHLNPSLGILRGDTILVTCTNGRRQRFTVTASFGTIGDVQTRKKWKPAKKVEETVYDMVLDGVFDLDD